MLVYTCLQLNQVSNRVFNEDLELVLKSLDCTSRQEHFLYATWQDLGTEMPLSTYRSAIGLLKPNVKVSVLCMLHLCPPDSVT